MTAKLKIKIDTGAIPALVSNKKILKLYCFYLTLKACNITRSGFVYYKNDIEAYCKIMNISKRTFYTRLNSCIYHGLLTRRKKGVILSKFGNVADLFGFRHTGKLLEFEANESRLEDQIRTMAIELNMAAQLNEVHRKISEIYVTSEHSPEELRLAFMAALTSAFIQGSTKTNLSCSINPDVTLSQYGMAKMFGLTSQTSGFYWQQTLVTKKLLDVENRFITSQSNAIKSTRLRGIVLWDPGKRTKALQLRNLLKPLFGNSFANI